MNGFLLWEPFYISIKDVKKPHLGSLPNRLRGFFNDVIVHLISLKIFGPVATVVLTGGESAGASLTIIRLK
ncbi:hypothetical protein AM232_02860 [Bacillus sp. FJAT-21352]|nr:hypothetical protein AM232_02860 [Bacillus sp. FJAT-21352]